MSSIYRAAKKEKDKPQKTGLIFKVDDDTLNSDNAFTQFQITCGSRFQMLPIDEEAKEYVFMGGTELTRAFLLILLAMPGIELDGLKAFVEVPIANKIDPAIVHPDGLKAIYPLYFAKTRVKDFEFRNFITEHTIDQIIFLNEYPAFLEANGYNTVTE